MSEEVESQVEDSPVESQEVSQEVSPSVEAPEQQVEQPQQEQAVTQQEADYWQVLRGLPELQGKSDREAAAFFVNAMSRERAASKALAQYQQVMPHAQEYMKHRPEFDAWRQAQQTQQQQQEAAQQQAEANAKKFWNPPEVKESYRSWMTRDENGNQTIHPNAPLEAKEALLARQEYTRDFAQKFLDNPEETLAPLIEDFATRKAQELYEENQRTQHNESFVQNIEQENASWLFDENGQGTPEGYQVKQYIDEVANDGIEDPEARWKWSKIRIERDALVQDRQAMQQRIAELEAGLQGQAAPQEPEPVEQPPANTAEQNMDYLRKEASRRPSRSAGNAAVDPRVPKQRRGFGDMLMETASDRGLV